MCFVRARVWKTKNKIIHTSDQNSLKHMWQLNTEGGRGKPIEAFLVLFLLLLLPLPRLVVAYRTWKLKCHPGKITRVHSVYEDYRGKKKLITISPPALRFCVFYSLIPNISFFNIYPLRQSTSVNRPLKHCSWRKYLYSIC